VLPQSAARAFEPLTSHHGLGQAIVITGQTEAAPGKFSKFSEAIGRFDLTTTCRHPRFPRNLAPLILRVPDPLSRKGQTGSPVTSASCFSPTIPAQPPLL